MDLRQYWLTTSLFHWTPQNPRISKLVAHVCQNISIVRSKVYNKCGYLCSCLFAQFLWHTSSCMEFLQSWVAGHVLLKWVKRWIVFPYFIRKNIYAILLYSSPVVLRTIFFFDIRGQTSEHLHFLNIVPSHQRLKQKSKNKVRRQRKSKL